MHAKFELGNLWKGEREEDQGLGRRILQRIIKCGADIIHVAQDTEKWQALVNKQRTV